LIRECSDSDDNEPREDRESDEVIYQLKPQVYKGHRHDLSKPKDIRVKYFLVNFDSMAYMSRLRYIQGVSDEVIEVTERVFADYMYKINEKFFSYFD
jgi:hypothetical protein